MALISSNIGGGIVGIPFCFYYCGLPFGICLSLLMALLTQLANTFLMLSKDNCPRRYESYFEIGYATMGRASIFVIALCMVSTGVGVVIIYYIVMGDTISSVVT